MFKLLGFVGTSLASPNYKNIDVGHGCATWQTSNEEYIKIFLTMASDKGLCPSLNFNSCRGINISYGSHCQTRCALAASLYF